MRKATYSFVMSVRPFVRMEQLRSQRKDFREISYENFSKICRENSSFIKIWQREQLLYMKTYVHF